MGLGGDGAVKKSKSHKTKSDSYIKKPKQGRDVDVKNSKKSKKQKGNIKAHERNKYTAEDNVKYIRKSSENFNYSEDETTSVEDYQNEGESAPDIDHATSSKPGNVALTGPTMSWSEGCCQPCCPNLMNKAIVTQTPCRETICKNVRMVDEEISNNVAELTQNRLYLEKVSDERDFYREEFERLLAFLEKLGEKSQDKGRNEMNCTACQKKDKMIEYLQRENQVLVKEKFCLMSRLQQTGGEFDSTTPRGKCDKASCKRVERERDLLKLDIQRLEEETDSLRDNIRALSEAKGRDYVKSQQQRSDYEMIIRKLEDERRELMKAQGVRRLSINTLEEKVDMYSNMLAVCQEELNRTKSQYTQLKKLHEQCDNALLDTQAQLAEVEMELKRCQSQTNNLKRYGKGTQVSPSRCCTCANSETDPLPETSSFALLDDNDKIKQLHRDKDELLNALDLKTEKLFKCEKEAKEKDNIILQLKEAVGKLRNEVSDKERESRLLMDKYRTSEIEVDNKSMEIRSLQTETTEKQLLVDKIQNLLAQKETDYKSLQSEIDHLYKETHALTSSNHQFQTDSEQSKVQMSVAMETIHELEEKKKILEELIVNYNTQIKTLMNELEDSRSEMKRREAEVEELIESKHYLKTKSQELVMENKAREKKIYDLSCQCDMLRTHIESLDTKERVAKEDLEKENCHLRDKCERLQNKLFNCICEICDGAVEKCRMINCLFKGDRNPEAAVAAPPMITTKDKSLQAYVKETNATTIEQVMSMKPLEELSNRVITSQSTLPGNTDPKCHSTKDTIIAAMYQTVEPMSPFSHSPKDFRDDRQSSRMKKSLLDIISEQEEKLQAFYDAQVSSRTLQHDNESMEEGEDYIIHNVTASCKSMQVDSDELIFNRTRLETASGIFKKSPVSPPENFQ